MKRIGILISGRGSNMEAILTAMQNGTVTSASCAVVISDNPQAPGLARAREFGVPAVCTDRAEYPKRAEHEAAVAARLQEYNVDFVCLAGYMRILRGAMLQAFPGRILNMHPALLPAFPGMHAQQQALDYGVKLAGCTVHLVDAGTDTGPIILQAAVPVHDDDTAESLSARILKQEHALYPQAVQLMAADRLRVDGRRITILG